MSCFAGPLRKPRRKSKIEAEITTEELNAIKSSHRRDGTSTKKSEPLLHRLRSGFSRPADSASGQPRGRVVTQDSPPPFECPPPKSSAFEEDSPTSNSSALKELTARNVKETAETRHNLTVVQCREPPTITMERDAVSQKRPDLKPTGTDSKMERDGHGAEKEPTPKGSDSMSGGNVKEQVGEPERKPELRRRRSRMAVMEGGEAVTQGAAQDEDDEMVSIMREMRNIQVELLHRKDEIVELRQDMAAMRGRVGEPKPSHTIWSTD